MSTQIHEGVCVFRQLGAQEMVSTGGLTFKQISEAISLIRFEEERRIPTLNSFAYFSGSYYGIDFFGSCIKMMNRVGKTSVINFYFASEHLFFKCEGLTWLLRQPFARWF